MAYGTAAMLGVVSGGWLRSGEHATGGQGVVVLLYVTLSLAIAAGAWWRRQEVFPLTLLAGSWIAISTAWLAHSLRLDDLGELFVIALWLSASSTVAGMGLMNSLRRWRTLPDAGASA